MVVSGGGAGVYLLLRRYQLASVMNLGLNCFCSTVVHNPDMQRVRVEKGALVGGYEVTRRAPLLVKHAGDWASARRASQLVRVKCPS